MKAGIHPAYEEISVKCACGNSFKTRSTHKGDMRVEICSNCHPFFTGKQKLIDTEGRVDRFQKKILKSQEIQEAAKKTKAKKANPFLLPGVDTATKGADQYPISQVTLVQYSNNTFQALGKLINGRGA